MHALEIERAAPVRGQRGLREVVAQRPAAVVPYLIPKLCTSPFTLAHARALAAVAGVAGDSLHQQLDVALPAIIGELYLEAELLPPSKEKARASGCDAPLNGGAAQTRGSSSASR